MTEYDFEVEICELCKHNHSYNWLDTATMKREYDSECLKGHEKGKGEILKCNDFEKRLSERELFDELYKENKRLKLKIQTQKQIIDKQEMKLAEYNNQK